MNYDKKSVVLLTEKEVQELYKLNLKTLQRERCNGSGIPYVKLGRRVRYKVSDINAYLEKKTVGNHRYD